LAVSANLCQKSHNPPIATPHRLCSYRENRLKRSLQNVRSFPPRPLAGYPIDDYEDVLDDDGKDLLQKLDSISQQAIYFVEKLLEYGSLGAFGTLEEVDLNEVVTIDRYSINSELHQLLDPKTQL
jgi:hypothetical protein